MAIFRRAANMKIYFSAPQNTPYQREFIQACSEKIRALGLDVYVSTDAYINHQPAFEVTAEVNGEPLYSDDKVVGKLAKSPFAQEVFSKDYAQLASADALVALLDGSQVDDRVAIEIGIFYGLMRKAPGKKGILGFATDARCLRRKDSTYGVNIFTLGTLEEVGKVCEDFEQVLEELKV